MQNPWVLSVFSGIFILLALSLLGLFEIRLPEKFEMRLLGISRHQKSGSYVGVAVMGVLSTLILSPCVTAPLIGALTYISETHDVVFGGSALFFLSLGMGIPLLVMGTLGGHFLPRAGAWMNSIKSFFGILLLAVAIEILSRILPPSIPLFLWGALGILCAALLGLFNGRPPGRWKWLWRGLSLIFLIYSILLMIGGAMGNTNPLKPLENFNSSSSVTATEALFIPIKTPEDLSLQLNKAKENHQLTLLDFYADWCIACKDMARTTFANAEIQELLKKHFRLLQADVTNHDKIDQRLQQQLHVIAPPTLVVFDVDGREMKEVRMVGEVGPQAFKKWIEKVLKAHTPSPATINHAATEA
jgi:thiol:disulfide interchange protein DsbD